MLITRDLDCRLFVCLLVMCMPVASAQFVNFDDQSGDVVVTSRADGFDQLVQFGSGLPENFSKTFNPGGGSATAIDDTAWVTSDFTIPGMVTSQTDWLFSTTATTAMFTYSWFHSVDTDGNGGVAGSNGVTGKLQIPSQQPIYAAVYGFYETAFTGPPGGQTVWSIEIGNGIALDVSEQVLGGSGARFEIFEILDQTYNLDMSGFGFDASMTAYGDPNGVIPDASGSNGTGFGQLTFILSTEPIIPAAPGAAIMFGGGLAMARRRRPSAS